MQNGEALVFIYSVYMMEFIACLRLDTLKYIEEFVFFRNIPNFYLPQYCFVRWGGISFAQKHLLRRLQNKLTELIK